MLRKVFISLLFLASFALVGVVVAAAWWLGRPIALNPSALKSDVAEVSIPQGASARTVVQMLSLSGVQSQPILLYAWLRFSGASEHIKAGDYELTRDLTPRTLLAKLVRGDVAQRSITLAEGLTFAEWRQALHDAPNLRPDTDGLSDADIMVKLGRAGIPAEGHFFPDTYTYPKNSSDLALLKHALAEMDKRLALAWDLRVTDTPLKTPEEALVLASIVEKETGNPKDRTMVSGVFNNRLKKGMKLQTDPTVIYGLGEKYDGRIHKRDLETDTPWNTYTRAGLPPTPIAMPGMDSLLAAVKPAQTDALYFVARGDGDGSSQFSATLIEHNKAVEQFQLKRPAGKAGGKTPPKSDAPTPMPAQKAQP